MEKKIKGGKGKETKSDEGNQIKVKGRRWRTEMEERKRKMEDIKNDVHKNRCFVRCLYDDANPGGLQGLSDSHGNLFGQPLLNCGHTNMNQVTQNKQCL